MTRSRTQPAHGHLSSKEGKAAWLRAGNPFYRVPRWVSFTSAPWVSFQSALTPLAGDASIMLDEPAVSGREAVRGCANVMTLRQSFLQGFLTNATNPKATLFFLAVFTTMVSAETPLSVQVLYGIWMCLANAVWFVVVGLVFSSARVRRHFLRASCWIERAMGGLLIIFSARLLWECALMAG